MIEARQDRGSFLDRLPGVRGMRERSRASRLEEAHWTGLSERWKREYVRWASLFNTIGTDTYPTRVSTLAAQLREAGRDSNAAEIIAEERVSMERFCELALVVPITGVTRSELETLGFKFPPQRMVGYSIPQFGQAWLTEYPAGWHVEPLKPDRLDSTGSRWATVYDELDQARMSIFWSDSLTGNKGLQARAEILPKAK